MAALSVVQPSMIILEFIFLIPPPFRFAQRYSGETAVAELPVMGEGPVPGASLSYLVDLLASTGYLFYKLNHQDAVWVHASLAKVFESAEPRLKFPVDEWACYLQTPFFLGDRRMRFPLAYT